MANRQPFCMILIGTNGTGKTTFIKRNFVEKSKRRVLIIDPRCKERAWHQYKRLDLEDLTQLRTFKGIRLADANESYHIALIEENYTNGVLVMDDFSFYIENNMPQSLRQLLIRRRQSGLDIFAMTHGFTDVPPKFVKYLTHFIVFKTLDSPRAHRDKIGNFDEFIKVVHTVNADPDPHAYRIIDLKQLIGNQ